MTQLRPQRKLAAILVADAVGYSKLMRADETATLALLNTIRHGTIDHDETPVKRGDAAQAMPGGTKHYSASFYFPYQGHASMGPSCAVADYKQILKKVLDGRPSGMRQRLAEAIGKNRSFVSQISNSAYQVPIQVRPQRQQSLAIRWLLAAIRSKSGRPTFLRLADELMAAARREGEAMSKREQTIKMAEANKAFSHFAW